MAEQPHGLKAETGTVELHHEPAAFGVITAPMFVAIAMLVVLGIVLWKRVPHFVLRIGASTAESMGCWDGGGAGSTEMLFRTAEQHGRGQGIANLARAPAG